MGRQRAVKPLIPVFCTQDMITTDVIDGTDRRNAVRRLADISDAVLSQADLDAEIDRGDAIAKTMFDEVPEDQDKRTVFVEISDMQAAIRILSGTNDDAHVETIKLYMRRVKDIMMSYTDRAPSEDEQYSASTGSVAELQSRWG